MHKKPFAIILFLWILLIAVFHNIATAYYIYWSYEWSDLVVHFLSGLWIALVGFWLFRFWKEETFKFSVKKILLVTLVFAALVGVFWEIFEYAIGIVEYSSKYTTDTILDILMDILGGATGFAMALWYEKKLDISAD
jgi:membrane associated rhomboid family serine protease